MRIFITVSFRGANYAGWQCQKNAVTVQELLEGALQRETGARVVLHGASRTDAGVSAKGFAAHFDWEAGIPPEKIFLVLNTRLPPDIRVTSSRQVRPDFHARYMALGKRYVYRIYNAPAASALLHDTTFHLPGPLALAPMESLAEGLCGEHDFASFCAAGSVVKSTVRKVEDIQVSRTGELVEISVTGNGFLYNMVRILAGTLIEAGQGRRNPQEGAAILAAKKRTAAGFTAPAHGLVLDEVFYPPEAFLL